MAKSVDRDRTSLRRAARVGIMIPFGYWLASGPLALGPGATYLVFAMMVLLAFTEFRGDPRSRLRGFVVAAVAGAIVIAFGAACSQSKIVAVIGAFVVTFAVMYVSVLRGYFAAAARGLLLALALSIVQWHMSTDTFLKAEMGWLLGAALATAAALLLWPEPLRPQTRARIADGVEAAADATRAIWDPSGGKRDPSVITDAIERLRVAHDQVRSAYDGAPERPGAGNAQGRAFMQLVDQLTHLRLALVAQAHDPPTSALDECDRQLVEVAAASLEGCANRIRGGTDPVDLEQVRRARDEGRRAISARANAALAAGNVDVLTLDARSTFGIRIISLITEFVCDVTASAFGDDPRDQTAPATSVAVETRLVVVLRRHLRWSSPWLRNSVRGAAALALAVGVAALTDAPVAFWVVLGASTALRFSAVGTGKTAAQAIAGTILGLAIASGLIIAVGPTEWVYWSLLPVTAFLATYTMRGVAFVLSQAAFTVLLMVAFSLILGPNLDTGAIRLIDVALGAACSLLMSALLWPRGVAHQVAGALQQAVRSVTDYLTASVDSLLGGTDFREEAERARGLAAGDLQIAYEVFDLSIGQPTEKPLNREAWVVIANAMGQVYFGSNHMFRAQGLDFRRVPCPQLADDMIAATHSIRMRLIARVASLPSLEEGAVHVLRPSDLKVRRPAPRGLLGDPIAHMRDGMAVCLDRVVGATDRPDGATIVSLLWAQEWLAFLSTRCAEVDRVRPVPAGTR